ncbi:rhodanese-like domain-containing protein, partial [Phycicoccus sp. CMS6Z-2]|nr:rhodanese-like domain-containing protein [Phycicoccus flavus]
YPGGTRNDRFVDEVRAAGLEPGRPVYCLCRSGVRSMAAAEALTAAGLGPAYNVVDGFEGPHDAAQHRTLGGWKNSGLPWRQG